MINTVVARRYANAIFALSEKEGTEALTKRGECLAGLKNMIAATPGLDLTLKSPVVSIEEKKAVLEKLLDRTKADKIVKNFCYTTHTYTANSNHMYMLVFFQVFNICIKINHSSNNTFPL